MMTTVGAGLVKFVPIKDIKITRRYREDFGNMDFLVESIKDKGILQPITLSKDLTLLAGERRLVAAKEAGLTEIPALVRNLKHEDMDAREIELLENICRLNFSWQEECALIKEIDTLYKAKHIAWTPKEGGGMQPGWSNRKTAELLGKSDSSIGQAINLANALALMPELATHKTADDARKVIRQMEEQVIVHEMRSRQIDPKNETLGAGLKRVLLLAESNYIIGDTFEGMANLRKNGVISVIECDPPYGINLNEQKKSKESVTSNVHDYQEVPTEDYNAFLTKLAIELFRVASRNCWLVFWFGPTWQHEVKMALTTAGWLVDDIPCVWIKGHGQTMQPELYLGRAYEPFFMCRKGNPSIMQRGRLNVFNYSGVAGQSKYHPTQRPVELIEEILNTLGTPVSVVFVPFLGSGATIRAAYNLGMKVFGFDLDDRYKDKFMLAVEQDSRALTEVGTETTEE